MDPELTQALLVSKLLVNNKVINDMVKLLGQRHRDQRQRDPA